MENIHAPNGNRTYNIPASSAVTQPHVGGQY